MADEAEKPTISDERLQEMGRSLLLARKRSRLSQTDVAEKLGVDYKTISRLENGLHTPQLATLDALADLYSASLDELTGRRSPSGGLQPISPGGLRVHYPDAHAYIAIRIQPTEGNAVTLERALEIKAQIKRLFDDRQIECAFIEGAAPPVDATPIEPVRPEALEKLATKAELATVARQSSDLANLLIRLINNPETARSLLRELEVQRETLPEGSS